MIAFVGAITAILLMMGGCTTIDRQIAGWPQNIRITRHEMTFFEVQGKCWQHMPMAFRLMGGVALACAEVNLDAGTCDIYHMRNPSKADMEHEESHCNGGDHDGILQEYFDRWKKGG